MNTMKLLIGLTMVASVANAQGKKAKLVAQNTTTAAKASAPSEAVTASATQTMVADAAASKPVAKSRFGLNLGYEASAGIADVKENNSRALIDADTLVGLTFKPTDKIKTELRAYFATPTISDRAQIANSMAAGKDEPFKVMDPTAHFNYSTDLTVAGSKPLTIASRYYIPVSDDSVKAGSNGTLRTQTSMDWDLNPKVTISAMPQVRLKMNSGRGEKANPALGADSILRLIPAASLTYNFSDALNAYYQPFMDLQMTGHQRGAFLKADKKNELWQEAGLNFMAGPVTINPAWTTFASAEGTAGYEGMGSDANSYYLLNVYANF